MTIGKNLPDGNGNLNPGTETDSIHFKMEKLDVTLSTYVQYVEDFKFWVNVAGRSHRP